jgi:hypothetical protein
VVAFAANSFATSVSFGDNNRYWGDTAGWSTGQKWATDTANGAWDGNKIDVIGDPNITGGIATFTSSGRLQSVSFNYYAPFNTWNMLSPGNLFINKLNNSSDTIWDYVVNTMGNPKTQGTDKTASLHNYNVNDISAKNISAQRNSQTGNQTIAQANPNYILSGQDDSGIWKGYYIRDNHPIGISAAGLADSTIIGSASFSGFPGATSYTMTPEGSHPTGTATYDFSGLAGGGLDLGGKDIILAWETTCANDVLYEKVNNPVPEPSTLILLSAGLFGAGILIKRKRV